MPRFYTPLPLKPDQTLDLPAGAARHVQVLRLQPDSVITLFNGAGGEFEAKVTAMGRSSVSVQVLSYLPIDRECDLAVHLALGVPANERMDWLVEKATELCVASIQPLMTERGVLRLSGERADKKQAHWQAIASAACEQSGRNRLPVIHAVQSLPAWLKLHATNQSTNQVNVILSLQPASKALSDVAPLDLSRGMCILSGAEGGLSSAEEALAMQSGFAPVSLGSRVLRAETAALAALAKLVL
jgi:16S rRNA (uracil1498-N3)-methyltransferase